MSDPPKRGRPRLDPDGPPSARVSTSITAAEYDQAYVLARQRRESISDLIRRSLRRELQRALPPPR